MTLKTIRTCRFLSVFVIAALLLQGCATGSLSADDPNLTPEERALREQADDFNRTVAEGVVAGAALGALLGALASGGRPGRGAAIGAVAGSVAGGFYGNYVGQQKQRFANEHARLDAMVADVESDNLRLEAYIRTTDRVIADNKKQLKELNAQVAEGKISEARAQADLQRIRKNQEAIQAAIDRLKTNRKEYINAALDTQRTNPNVDVTPLDREIASLEENIRRLEAQYRELDRAIAVTQIG